MSANTSLLPKEVTALVHHVELHRAGWWDKTVHRLVLAAVWLSDRSPSTYEIQKTLKEEFRLSLSAGKLSSALSALESQGLLVPLPDDSFRIPDKQRAVFEQDIAATEKVEANARGFFFRLVKDLCAGLDAQAVWSVFESEFLGPLIKEVGANTYRFIAGERVIVNKSLADRFLKQFESGFHPKLNELVTTFLDPKKDEVRAYISRMLHARFCVEASGLPEDVIQRLSEVVGKQVRFRVFVDTNLLFSLLELHENPSNAAAREFQELITQLRSNPKIELFIIPRTIEEAKSSIASVKFQLSGVPAGMNFTQAALQVGFSGMVERFLSERLRRGGMLTAEEWFGPYLNDFVPIAHEKGIELFDEKLDSYSMRQDVVDDINLVLKFEEKFPQSRRKSYKKVAHDMILWHFVNDKRPAYIESPIDAQDWILTVDFRLIGFDEHKQKKSASKVPLCLHPTSLIQLLQFWVPRTKEFEEAILGSFRLPFLFQEFDMEAERTSLKILKGLGRFEGGDRIPEQTITRVILNEGLRSRLKSNPTEAAEVALIRDALLEEVKARADAEANKTQLLQNTVKEQDAALIALDVEKRAKDAEIEKLKTTVAEETARSKASGEKLVAQSSEINKLKSKWQKMEEDKNQRLALFGYFGLLAAVISVSGITAWQIDRFFPKLTRIVGSTPTKSLAAVFAFLVGHLLLERWARGNQRMAQIWPFKQVGRFRKRLWVLVGLGFVVGVSGNLFANRIQKNLDQEQQRSASSPRALVPDSGGSKSFSGLKR